MYHWIRNCLAARRASHQAKAAILQAQLRTRATMRRLRQERAAPARSQDRSPE